MIEARGEFEFMNPFVKYMEEALHIKTKVCDYTKQNELPLYLRNNYDFLAAIIQDIEFLLIYPKEQTNLTTIRKQANQLKKLTGLDCVLCLDNVRAYTKEKMLAEGIPFIIPGKQVYMPFLGVALSNSVAREILPVEKLSFGTQRLLLTAIYSSWTQTSLKEAANALGLTKMSISRCFDELQSVGLYLVKTIGKARYFSWSGNRRELWDTVAPFLRSPVKRQYCLGESIDIKGAKLGGISALCHYSMLADNPYNFYAVPKDTAKFFVTAKLPLIPETESPVMVIQVMQYDMDYTDAHAIDPLTAILSISEEDKADPRVEGAITKILGECLHD